MYKYSVLECIFNDYEFVREVQNKQDDVEYVLVTDNKNLKSGTWKVIYDEHFANMPLYKKFHWVRYHPFNYITTDLCVSIDGSIQIKDSLDKLVSDFVNSGSDIGLMPHPCIPVFVPELAVWVTRRNYPVEMADRFLKFLYNVDYKLNYNGYFQVTVMIRKRTKLMEMINNIVYDFMMSNSDDDHVERLDQTWFTFVMNKFFSWCKVFLMHPQITESYAMQRCEHRTEQPASIAGKYDINIPYYAWCFNEKRECYYLKR